MAETAAHEPRLRTPSVTGPCLPTRTGLPRGPKIPKLIQTYFAFHHTEAAGRFLRDRYGEVFTLEIFPWGTVVVIGDVQAVREIFTGDPAVFHAGEGNTPLEPVLGSRSVLLLDEEEHLRERQRLLPPFHGELVHRHEQLIEELVTTETERWPFEEAFALYPHLRAITLEVTLRIVIGVEDPVRLRSLRMLLPQAVAASPVIALMWIVGGLGRVWPWRRYRDRIAQAHAVLAEEIAARRAVPDLERRTDALSQLVKLGKLDDASLRDQIMSMLLGHETTASGLAWAVERLLRHPRALARACEGDDAYLDAVVKETLRVRHVIPIVTRRLTRPVELAGYHLPAGITLLPAVAFVHENPDVFSQPTAFRPERFLDEHEGSTYTWIPFGGGVRRCIGAGFASSVMRVVLRTILTRTKLWAPDCRDERMARPSWIALVPGRGVRVVRSV